MLEEISKTIMNDFENCNIFMSNYKFVFYIFLNKKIIIFNNIVFDFILIILKSIITLD